MPALHPTSVGIEPMLRHTLALADLATPARLDLPVPTCGDWDLADLVWHLTEVQAFWGFAIARRPTGPEAYEEPARPDDVSVLADGLRDVAQFLAGHLDGLSPDEYAWSWADEHTVGFTLRRQAQEALVHHIDGVLAVGGELPEVSAEFAADGVDELVQVMLCGIPEWGTFTPSGRTVRVQLDDIDHAWTIAIGTMSGTSPASGTTYEALPAGSLIDGPTPAAVDDTSPPTGVVTGSALDVLLWMWGRVPASVVDVRGDSSVGDELRALVVDATQ